MKTSFTMDEARFISDTHYGHANIIKYCDRPFTYPETYEMDMMMLAHFKEADAAGKTIFHCGDFLFNTKNLLKDAWRPTGQHYIVLGNHDKGADPTGKHRALYGEYFTHIIGTSSTWKTHTLRILVDGVAVVLSHEPQRHLGDAQYNVYGHHHNNLVRPNTHDPELVERDYGWIFDNDRYYNAGVELTNYKAVSLEELSTLPRPTKSA